MNERSLILYPRVGLFSCARIKDAGSITLGWLLVYNIALGALSIVVATPMWRAKRGNRGVFGIAASHLGVLGFVGSLWLQDSAALQSVQAMVFRSVVWVMLSFIVHFHLRSLEASACFVSGRPHC